MTGYLVHARYTPEASAALLENRRDRQQAVAPLVENVGARYERAATVGYQPPG